MDNEDWDMADGEAEGEEAPTRATRQMATIQAILAPFLQRQAASGGSTVVGGIDLRGITLDDLNQLLRSTAEPEEEAGAAEEDDDDEEDEYYRAFRNSGHSLYFRKVTEPQEPGVQLIHSGEFGRVGPKIKSRRKDLNIAKQLRSRASQARPRFYKEDYTSDLFQIPMGPL
ncbi:hypothetical protein B0H14DRAFT_1100582 [Mycena olivaceomarginata]|nr:hypothetical protein B0H14DRAFT_1100582 [Mycena olivaceomarginata]